MLESTPCELLQENMRVHVEGRVWKVVGKPLFAQVGNGNFVGKDVETGELKTVKIQRGERLVVE